MFNRMVKCEKGHKYDKKKHSSCPYCGVNINLDIVRGHCRTEERERRDVDVENRSETATLLQDDFTDDSTILAEKEDDLTVIHTLQDTAASDEKYLDKKDLSNDWYRSKDAVVGWFVAIEGPNQYCDLKVRNSDNFIGINFNGELSVVSEKAEMAKVYFKISLNRDNEPLCTSGIEQIQLDGIPSQHGLVKSGSTIEVNGNKLQFQEFRGGTKYEK